MWGGSHGLPPSQRCAPRSPALTAHVFPAGPVHRQHLQRVEDGAVRAHRARVSAWGRPAARLEHLRALRWVRAPPALRVPPAAPRPTLWAQLRPPPFTSRSSAAALRPPGCSWPTAPPRVSSARGRRGAVRASPAPQCAPVRGRTRPHPPPVCQREPEGKRAGVGGLTCSTASCPASSPSRLKDMAAPSAAPPSPWGAPAVRFRVLRPVVPRAGAGTNGERGAAEPRGTTGVVVLRRTSALGPEGRGTTTPSGLRAGPERAGEQRGAPLWRGVGSTEWGPGTLCRDWRCATE